MEKARQYQSKAILDYTEELTHLPNLDGTPESNLHNSAYILRLLDAVVGEPYRENGTVHNSLLLDRRVRAQFWLACGYAGTGQLAPGIQALEKGVEMCLLYLDALKENCFTSDYVYLEPQENTEEDGSGLLEWCIGAFEAPHGWEWLDPIRSDERFETLHQRLLKNRAASSASEK